MSRRAFLCFRIGLMTARLSDAAQTQYENLEYHDGRCTGREEAPPRRSGGRRQGRQARGRRRNPGRDLSARLFFIGRIASRLPSPDCRCALGIARRLGRRSVRRPTTTDLVSLPYPASAEPMWRDDELYDLWSLSATTWSRSFRRRERDFPPHSNTGFRADRGLCRRPERGSTRPAAAVGSGQSDHDQGLRRKPGNRSQSMTRPFEGIRIIDATHVLAGPFAAISWRCSGRRHQGRGPRRSRPEPHERHRPCAQPRGMGICYLTQGSNKRSITLDLKIESGRDILQAVGRDAPTSWSRTIGPAPSRRSVSATMP